MVVMEARIVANEDLGSTGDEKSPIS